MDVSHASVQGCTRSLTSNVFDTGCHSFSSGVSFYLLQSLPYGIESTDVGRHALIDAPHRQPRARRGGDNGVCVRGADLRVSAALHCGYRAQNRDVLSGTVMSHLLLWPAALCHGRNPGQHTHNYASSCTTGMLGRNIQVRRHHFTGDARRERVRQHMPASLCVLESQGPLDGEHPRFAATRAPAVTILAGSRADAVRDGCDRPGRVRTC